MTVGGRVGVTLITVITLVIVCFNLRFLGKTRIFTGESICCLTFRSITKIARGYTVCTGNIDINAIANVACSCDRTRPAGVTVSITGGVIVPRKSRTRVGASLVNGARVGLLLTSCGGTPLPIKKAVCNGRSNKLLNRTTTVLPAVRRVLPGISSVLCAVGALLTSPTIGTVVCGTRRVAGRLAASTTRLGHLLTRIGDAVPTVLNGTGTLVRRASALSRRLTRLSLDKVVAAIGDALTDIRDAVSRLSGTRNAVNGLLGSDRLCSGLTTAVTSTSSLIISLGRRPGQCIRFSLFNGGSGWQSIA